MSAVSGAIWRFQDKDDDGVAETREKIVSSFGYTGNAADVHGCFLGPEGRIYWCEGRHGHDITDAAGKSISKGKAARIFSCRPDGSDVRMHCGGGMDNPVEIDWTAEGEMLGTVNIFYSKRGDCLVHWMHGGVYPRHDQPAVLAEFRRTGELLDAVHDYGHVAVSGCCRVRAVGRRLRAVPEQLRRHLPRHRVQHAQSRPHEPLPRRRDLPRRNERLPASRQRRLPSHRRAGRRRRQLPGDRHRRLVPHRLPRPRKSPSRTCSARSIACGGQTPRSTTRAD